MSKVYVGDIGTVITVDCGTTITGATDLALNVRKPDGTEVEWVPAISGTDSLEYTTVSGDFDQAGRYKLQASLTIDGWSGLGEVASFLVYSSYG